jgi:hypothetical protein
MLGHIVRSWRPGLLAFAILFSILSYSKPSLLDDVLFSGIITLVFLAQQDGREQNVFIERDTIQSLTGNLTSTFCQLLKAAYAGAGCACSHDDSSSKTFPPNACCIVQDSMMIDSCTVRSGVFGLSVFMEQRRRTVALFHL